MLLGSGGSKWPPCILVILSFYSDIVLIKKFQIRGKHFYYTTLNESRWKNDTHTYI